ncbi:MAG: periplasmic binding protein/LacI transcriptional regulator [Bacillales bacterium]|jgi:LacI family transcriptional regulator|nr:periplasmic binding protein/LacI transcriptional regulator [Bacillales bacterium]
MKLTIKDIARIANVSPTTVSRVMNGKTEYVTQETQERVLKVIEETNYQPNQIARSLVTRETRTIGLVLPDIRNPFFTELSRGIEDYANQLGYFVILCNTDHKSEKEIQYISLLKDKYIDGLIVVSSLENPISHIKKITTENTPIVLIDHKANDEEINCVYFNNYQGGYLATKHLIDLGHKNIGCITGPLHVQSAVERFNGYKDALRDNNISFKDEFIFQGNYRYEDGIESAKYYKSIGVTSIFASNDLMALGANQKLAELGVKIPEDISIVGLDNITPIGISDSFLTTINQPFYEMGKTACSLLLDQLKGLIQTNKNIQFDATLVLGKSTAHPKK